MLDAAYKDYEDQWAVCAGFDLTNSYTTAYVLKSTHLNSFKLYKLDVESDSHTYRGSVSIT